MTVHFQGRRSATATAVALGRLENGDHNGSRRRATHGSIIGSDDYDDAFAGTL